MKHEKLIYTGIVVAGIAALTGLYAINSKAISMAMAGHGHEVYRNLFLVPFSYNGLLILEAAILLVLLFAGTPHIREYLLERSLLKKYPKQEKRP